MENVYWELTLFDEWIHVCKCLVAIINVDISCYHLNPIIGRVPETLSSDHYMGPDGTTANVQLGPENVWVKISWNVFLSVSTS